MVVHTYNSSTLEATEKGTWEVWSRSYVYSKKKSQQIILNFVNTKYFELPYLRKIEKGKNTVKNTLDFLLHSRMRTCYIRHITVSRLQKTGAHHQALNCFPYLSFWHINSLLSRAPYLVLEYICQK